MVARVLAAWYRLHQDDGTYPPVNFDAQKPDGSGPLNLNVNVRSEAHTTLNREIAAASHVLLKNINRNAGTGAGNKMLPLSGTGTGLKTVAVIGQDAKTPKNGCNLNECNEGVMVIGCVSFYDLWTAAPILMMR
jgi:beta-glucosidase